MDPRKPIPYAKHWIDDDDIAAVVEVLKSDWLTTGPIVAQFEGKMAEFTGAIHGIAVNSGTAALHAAMNALEVGPNDEVIVPTITFLATANAVVYQGATPIFADVMASNLTIDPSSVADRLSSKTKAIIAVDYAGHPCAYDELQSICDQAGIKLVVDACHSLGAQYHGRPCGTLGDMTCLSFHPAKNITTGEGGMVLTNQSHWDEAIRRFRNHGINLNAEARRTMATWYYEMGQLGFNYRITDIQCALGLSQLNKLPSWLEKRRLIAAQYDKALAAIPGVHPLITSKHVQHAYHLYVVRLDPQLYNRSEIFSALHEQGVLANVHYIPLHLQPYYKNRPVVSGPCPVAEKAYEEIISLPMFPAMSPDDIDRVISTLAETCERLIK